MDAHLRELRYFAAVAEELNFTRAAERLHVSQPALSKQIRALEAALHVRLLQRDSRRVSLTAAGAVLHSAAKQLLDDWDATVAAAVAAAAEQASLLRVGILTGIGRDLYPGVLARFAARVPGWRVELRTYAWDDATAGLADATTDAALTWLPVDDERVAHRPLATEPRWVAVSARHRLSRRTSVAFTELLDEPFIALPKAAGTSRDFWLALDARGGRPVRIAAEVTSVDETFEAVAAGTGIVLLAQGNVALYARPDVAFLPVEGLEPARLAVAWLRTDRRPAVRAFVEACTAAAVQPRSSGAVGEPASPLPR